MTSIDPQKGTSGIRAVSEQTTSLILVVDDNANNRLLLASQLEMHGYTIIEAADGKEGLEKAIVNQPDLVLLDAMMPFMDGFETCKRLKSDPTTSNIPVIMVTALRDIKDRIEGIKAGADEFLSRPHNRDELLIRVKSLISLKHARDKLEEERNRLKLLYEVTKASTNTRLNLSKTISEVLAEIRMAVGANRGSIIFRESAGAISHHISIREGMEPVNEASIDPVVLEKGLAGWIFHNNVTEIIDDISIDSRWITLPHEKESKGAVIGVPLVDDQNVRGVLILNHSEIGYFQPDHQMLLEAIANQVTVAIENAYLFNQVDDERRKMEAILAESSDGIIVTNENFEIEMMNSAALSVFPDDGIDKYQKRITDLSSLQELHPLFTSNNQNSIMRQEVKGIGNKVFLASVTSVPAIGYLVILQDVTERKLNEEMRLEAERYKTEHVKRTFSRYMSPTIVDKLLEEPDVMHNKRVLAVVLFADLRNSTSMILNEAPSESIKVLNEFFSTMSNVVVQNEGTIFDMVGDELMIAFNAPFEQPDAPKRAIHTAISMQKAFAGLQDHWQVHLDDKLGLGIGIDMGYVVMGNIGREETRLNFGLVGGTVNMGKRLVDKAYDHEIIVSSDFYDAMHKQLKEKPDEIIEALEFEAEDNVDLKGNPDPQRIYRTRVG
ncbi:MAG: response regulator [Chloroflexota bacterium]